MKVTIELWAGPDHRRTVTAEDIQKNIDALERAIDGKTQVRDTVLLSDTKSILEGIQDELMKEGR